MAQPLLVQKAWEGSCSVQELGSLHPLIGRSSSMIEKRKGEQD